MTVDVVCSQPGYISHLVPVWIALPEEQRGLFCAPSWFSHRIPFPTTPSQPRHGEVVLAAAVRDFKTDRHQYRVHLEHGVGQTYSTAHPAYPGGAKREIVDLFLCPSQRVADLEGPRAVVVGAPKLDRYSSGPQGGAVWSARWAHNPEVEGSNPSPATKPIVGMTWHWDASGICPEAGTAWWEFHTGLHELAKEWQVLGHAHPRIEQNTTQHYARAGIEVTLDFGEVIRRADVLVCDNSSAQPEFAAATGRPLVFLNAKAYRRDVDHGQRFWDWPEGQIQCDSPEGLDAAIRFALDDPGPVREAREAMVGDAYSVLDGRAAKRCVEEILKCSRS